MTVTRLFPILALLAGLAAWALMSMTAMNLLSGNFADRECQTACVQGYYFGAAIAAVVGLVLGIIAISKSGLNYFTSIATLLPLSVAGIVGFLYFAGTVLI